MNHLSDTKKYSAKKHQYGFFMSLAIFFIYKHFSYYNAERKIAAANPRKTLFSKKTEGKNLTHSFFTFRGKAVAIFLCYNMKPMLSNASISRKGVKIK